MNFYGAVLDFACLWQADLCGTNLRFAKMFQAICLGAKMDVCTNLKDVWMDQVDCRGVEVDGKALPPWALKRVLAEKTGKSAFGDHFLTMRQRFEDNISRPRLAKRALGLEPVPQG